MLRAKGILYVYTGSGLKNFQLLFSAINIFYRQLPMPWDDTIIVELAVHAWLIYALLLLAMLCDYALLYLHAGK